MDVGHYFGIVVKTNRNRLGFSQEELAYRCGLDRTFISLLERGKRNPTLATVFSISKGLNISPYQLIYQVECLIIKK